MKRAAFLFLAVAMLTSCSGSKTDTAVKRDFERYKEKMSSIANIETNAISAHMKVTESGTIKDPEYGKFLRETFLPGMAEFYAQMKRIDPATEEVMAVHKLLLMRTALRIGGFSDLEKSTRTGNAALIESAKMKNRQSDLYAKMWSKKMDGLNKLYK